MIADDTTIRKNASALGSQFCHNVLINGGSGDPRPVFFTEAMIARS